MSVHDIGYVWRVRIRVYIHVYRIRVPPSIVMYGSHRVLCAFCLRNDIVRVLPGNNGSLSIQASQQGEAIVRVWLREHAHIDDYIRVRVGFAVTPNMATVHLGTKICFSTHLALEGGCGCVW